MQRVIDIPEILYTKIQNGKADKRTLETVILYGTPLPKSHGRLIDADAFIVKDLEDRCPTFNLDIPSEYGVPRIWFERPIEIDYRVPTSSVMGYVKESEDKEWVKL